MRIDRRQIVSLGFTGQSLGYAALAHGLGEGAHGFFDACGGRSWWRVAMLEADTLVRVSVPSYTAASQP